MSKAKKILIPLFVLVVLFNLIFLCKQHNGTYATKSETIVVMGYGDYQTKVNDHEVTSSNFVSILDKIKNDYSSVDGALCVGDYSDIYTKEHVSEGIASVNTDLNNSGLGFDHRVFVQGNHDPIESIGITPTGAADPSHGKYASYVINEDDYMWGQGYQNWTGSDPSTHKEKVLTTAENLRIYLQSKIDNGYTKPIFIVSHLALNYSFRTYQDGDGQYGRYIFDVINSAAKSGLNIIFLYGHNHSKGWDNYLGSSSVFLKAGDVMPIANYDDKNNCSYEKLHFTYMNAGYVGYYSTEDENDGADRTLTVTMFEIDGDKVTIKRYSKNGIHNLKSKGVYNTKVVNNTTEQNFGQYTPDARIYTSPQVVNLNDGTKDYLIQNKGSNWSTNENYDLSSENFDTRNIVLDFPISDENVIKFNKQANDITVSSDFEILGKSSSEIYGKFGLVFTDGASGFFFYANASGIVGEDLNSITGRGFGVVKMSNGSWNWSTDQYFNVDYNINNKINLKIIRERSTYYLYANGTFITDISSSSINIDALAEIAPQIRSFNVKLKASNYTVLDNVRDNSRLAVVTNKVVGDSPYNTASTAWDLSSAYERTSSNFNYRRAVLSQQTMTSSNELFFNSSNSAQITVQAKFTVTGKAETEKYGKFGLSYVNDIGNGFYFYVDAQGSIGTAVSTITGTSVGVVVRENGSHDFSDSKSLTVGEMFQSSSPITLKMVRDFDAIKLYADSTLVFTLSAFEYGIDQKEKIYPSVKSYNIALEMTEYDCIGKSEEITFDGQISDWQTLNNWQEIEQNKKSIVDYISPTSKYVDFYTMLTDEGLYVYALAKHTMLLSGSNNWWENNNFEFFFNGNGTFNQFFASISLVRGFNSFAFLTEGNNGNYITKFEGFISKSTLEKYIQYNGASIKYGAAFKVDNGSSSDQLFTTETDTTSYWMAEGSNPRNVEFTVNLLVLQPEDTPETEDTSSSSTSSSSSISLSVSSLSISSSKSSIESSSLSSVKSSSQESKDSSKSSATLSISSQSSNNSVEISICSSSVQSVVSSRESSVVSVITSVNFSSDSVSSQESILSSSSSLNESIENESGSVEESVSSSSYSSVESEQASSKESVLSEISSIQQSSQVISSNQTEESEVVSSSDSSYIVSESESVTDVTSSKLTSRSAKDSNKQNSSSSGGCGSAINDSFGICLAIFALITCVLIKKTKKD